MYVLVWRSAVFVTMLGQVDEVSSIGGMTSVATMMRRQRKAGLVTTDDADGANSTG